MPKPTLKPLTAEEAVTAALNEHGYLFSQAVRQRIAFDLPGPGQPQKAWKVLASEYSVTAADGSQTRIDYLLRSTRNQGAYVCIECKRALPAFKRWVFFDKTLPAHTRFIFESFWVNQRPIRSKTDAQHGAQFTPTRNPCDTYNLYVEAAANRDGRWSCTDTIEGALLQAVKGQSGFMAKQHEFCDAFRVIAVPVVVTTAQLFEAVFDLTRLSTATAQLDAKDLKLQPLEFCAVQYHPDDALAVRSQYSPRDILGVEDDANWQTRTVFVVQSQSFTRFLAWLDASVVPA